MFSSPSRPRTEARGRHPESRIGGGTLGPPVVRYIQRGLIRSGSPPQPMSNDPCDPVPIEGEMESHERDGDRGKYAV
jgi:hypothetical protein